MIEPLQNRKWKVLKSENSLRLGPWLSVRQEEVELPNGHRIGVIDPGETPLEAAQRELSEETGFGGGTWQEFMVLSPNPTNHNNRSITFLATDVEQLSAPHEEESEDIHVHVMTKEDVRELLEKGEIIQALHAAPLWKYFASND